MLTKSQLIEVFAQYGFRPLKRFGENYLIDSNIKDKMIGAAGISKKDIVLEVGPGMGALTIDLAKTCAEVYAVEKDPKAFGILKDLMKDDFPNVKLFNEDILKFDMSEIASNGKIKMVGNLPYYITTPIIEYLIERRNVIHSAIITVQREVANRLLAKPGTADYSSVSCFVQYYCSAQYIHTVKRTSFYPVPEVDSSIIKLDILIEPAVKVGDEKLFFRIIRGAFNQRRKSILNSLSREEVLGMPKEKLAALFTTVGIDPSARPETLSLEAFAKISALF